MSATTMRKLFSGRTFALFSAHSHCLTLNDLVAPVLLAHGAEVRRIYTSNNVPDRWAQAGFKPLQEMRGLPVDAVITVDARAHALPPEIPVITLPHAFWSEPHIETFMARYNFYAPSADYYCVQNSVAKDSPFLKKGIISTRRTDFVTLLPIGSLKIDALAEACASNPEKDALLLCLGKLAYLPFPPAAVYAAVDAAVTALLDSFAPCAIVLRPFPGDETHEALTKIRERHAHNPRFVYDASASTLLWMQRSAVVISLGSTTGPVFSRATGRAHIAFTLKPGRAASGTPQYVAASPGELCRAVESALQPQQTPGPAPDGDLYRPGHAKELFAAYLRKILNDETDERWLRVAVNNPRLPALQTEEEQSIFFAAALKSGTLASYQYFMDAEHKIFHNLHAVLASASSCLYENKKFLLLCNFLSKNISCLTEISAFFGSEVLMSESPRDYTEEMHLFLHQHFIPVPLNLSRLHADFCREDASVLLAPPCSGPEVFKAWLIKLCLLLGRPSA